MSPTLVARIVGRAIAVVQMVLGIVVWTGHGDSIVGVHIAVGLLLVVDLWIAIVLGLRSSAPIGLVVVALVWSVGMPVFGLVQTNLLPGGFHVAVQILHLVVGLAAVGLIEALAQSGGRHQPITG